MGSDYLPTSQKAGGALCGIRSQPYREQAFPPAGMDTYIVQFEGKVLVGLAVEAKDADEAKALAKDMDITPDLVKDATDAFIEDPNFAEEPVDVRKIS